MKKLFATALIALSLATSAFASDTKKISSRIQHKFKIEFANASDVSWNATDEYFKAAFIMDDQKMETFYDLQGQKIATSKSITLEEIPVRAKRTFAKKFDGYTVKEAIQFEGTDEYAYYISAENDKENIILKISDTDNLSVYKKTAK